MQSAMAAVALAASNNTNLVAVAASHCFGAATLVWLCGAFLAKLKVKRTHTHTRT